MITMRLDRLHTLKKKFIYNVIIIIIIARFIILGAHVTRYRDHDHGVVITWSLENYSNSGIAGGLLIQGVFYFLLQ